MLRKLLWVAGVVTVSSVALSLVDRYQAERRRQLWAEATD